MLNGARSIDTSLDPLPGARRQGGVEVSPQGNGLATDVAALFRQTGLEGVPYHELSSASRGWRDSQGGDRTAEQQVDELYLAGQEEQSSAATVTVEAPGSVSLSSSVKPEVSDGSETERLDPIQISEGFSLFLQVVPARESASEDMKPTRFPSRRTSRVLIPSDESISQPANAEAASKPASEGVLDVEGAASLPSLQPSQSDTLRAVEEYARFKPYASSSPKSEDYPCTVEEARGRATDQVSHDSPIDASSAAPFWLGAHLQERTPDARPELSAETLKRTRERVAKRWFAFRGLFESRVPDGDGHETDDSDELPPLLAIFSLAGGAGKTSLAASLTRSLAAQGERVLLVDGTSHDLLPFFFGAKGSRSGEPRVFTPPPGTADAPIQVMDLAAGTFGEQELRDRLEREGKGFSRIILDLATAALEDLNKVLSIGGTVLVPLLPDMTSLLTLRALKRVQEVESSTARGGVEKLWYLLTHFDPTQPLHLDVREVLEQELGERLLPFVVRRSAAVAEALAQGMTVIDYAPQDGVTKDIQQAAAWLRTLVGPAREGLGQVRWIER